MHNKATHFRPVLGYLSLIFLLILGACSPKSTLKKDEFLLGNQSFRGNSAVKTEDLATLLPQRPNKRFLAIPGATVSLWVYQYFDKRYDRTPARQKLDSLTAYYELQFERYANDTRKLAKLRRKYTRLGTKYQKRIESGNWWMQTVGEPPVYFSDKDAQSNAQKIKSYLINEGYRDAQVSFTTDTLLRHVRTTYTIKEGLPHRLRNVDIFTQKDSSLDSLLQKYKAESFLKPHQNYRNSDVNKESGRI